MAKPQSTRDLIMHVDNLDAATAFYENVLGLTVFTRDPGIVGIETGALRLFLDPGPAPVGPVLEFLVDDVQATKAALVAAGCTVEQEDGSVPRCYIRDPQGLIFNIGKR